MNGAESLARTLVASGVDTCFANPGTSEMHFVAALDKVDGLRCVLGLAEIVVTGCADGYARIAGKPAATLLHCGPGFANGVANIHNAKRANSPMLNIVGDQATYHRQYDAALTYDVEGIARTVSNWVKTGVSSATIGADAAAAVQAARRPPGQIATLILPADTAWNDGAVVGAALPVPEPAQVAPEVVKTVARVLRTGEPAILILTGAALSERGLLAAHRIAAATGATLRAPSHLPKMARGRGRVPVDRLPFALDAARAVLEPFSHVILVGGKPPMAFFAYPGKPSLLAAPGAATHVLARPEQDLVGALEWLADELGAPMAPIVPAPDGEPGLPRGKFDPLVFGRTLAALIPDDAIVVEDAATSGRALIPPTFNAAPHDWLQVTGGAIGYGLPSATGAAVAAPDRKVVCLQSDGAGMYSLQSLWTQARCNLDVITVIFANRAYKILMGELLAVGAKPGPASTDLFDIGRPTLDWVKLAGGMGVEAARVETLEDFADVFQAACKKRGPFLIELVF